MFTHPAIALDHVRERHRDFVAQADSYRLSRLARRRTKATGWSFVQVLLRRWVATSRAAGWIAAVTDHPTEDQRVVLGATEERVIRG